MNTMNVNNNNNNPTMSTTVYPVPSPPIVLSQKTPNTEMGMSSSPVDQTTTQDDGTMMMNNVTPPPIMILPTPPTGTTTTTPTSASTNPPIVVSKKEGPYSIKTVEFKFISINTEHFGTKQVQGFFRFQVIRDDSTGLFFPMDDPNFFSTESYPTTPTGGIVSSLAVAMASATSDVLGDLYVDFSSSNKSHGQTAGSPVTCNCTPEEIKSNSSVECGGVPGAVETATSAVDTAGTSTIGTTDTKTPSTSMSSFQILPIKGQICGPVLYLGIKADSSGFLSPVDRADPMAAQKQELASIDVMDFIRRGHGHLRFHTSSNKVCLELFCVLSEKNYNMDAVALLQGVVRDPQLGVPQRPQWEKLRSAYEKRCGHLFHEDTRTEQITSLVNEYIRFQALKIVRNDFNSKMFSPSNLVSGVWQTHLSMMEDYSADIMAFCRQIQAIRCTKFDGYPSWTWVGPINTDPMLEEDHFERYKLTYIEMTSEHDHANHLWYPSMLNLIMDHAPLPDMTWWPNPFQTYMKEFPLLLIIPEVTKIEDLPPLPIISAATEQPAPVVHNQTVKKTVGKKKVLANSSNKNQPTKKVGSKGKSKKKIKAKKNKDAMSKKATKSKSSSSPPPSSQTQKSDDEDVMTMNCDYPYHGSFGACI